MMAMDMYDEYASSLRDDHNEEFFCRKKNENGPQNVLLSLLQENDPNDFVPNAFK